MSERLPDKSPHENITDGVLDIAEPGDVALPNGRWEAPISDSSLDETQRLPQRHPNITDEEIEALKGKAHIETGEPGSETEEVEITDYYGVSEHPDGGAYSTIPEQLVGYTDSKGKPKAAGLERFRSWTELPEERQQQLRDAGLNPAELNALTHPIFENVAEAKAKMGHVDPATGSGGGGGKKNGERPPVSGAGEPPDDDGDMNEASGSGGGSGGDPDPRKTVQIDSPDSIPHNFTVYENKDNLLTAESRQNKATKLDDNYRLRQYEGRIPDLNEDEDSATPSEPVAEAPTGALEGDDSGERTPETPKAILPGMRDFDLEKHEEGYRDEFRKLFRPHLGDGVHYDEEPNENGLHRLGLKFDIADNSYIDWREILEEIPGEMRISSAKDLFVILKASGGQTGDYTGYINGGYIYEIVHRKVKQGDEMVDQTYIAKTELAKLPNLMMGQKFGDGFKLSSVEIAHNGGKASFDKDNPILKKYSRLGGMNPFIDAKEMIDKINSGATGWPIVEGQPSPTATGLDWKEALIMDGQTFVDRRVDDPDKLKGEIRSYAEKFKDSTYVPTPEEFSEMQELAEKINANMSQGDGMYWLTDGTILDPDEARRFIENARSEKWLMSDFHEDLYTAPLFRENSMKIQENTLFSVVAWGKANHPEDERWHDKHPESISIIESMIEKFREKWRSERGSLIAIEDFRKTKEQSGEYRLATTAEKKAFKEEIGRLYVRYLKDRIELSHSIKSGTRRHKGLREDKHSTSWAIREYAAYMAQEEEDKKRRREIELSEQETQEMRTGTITRRHPPNPPRRRRGADRIKRAVRENIQINRRRG